MGRPGSAASWAARPRWLGWAAAHGLLAAPARAAGHAPAWAVRAMPRLGHRPLAAGPPVALVARPAGAAPPGLALGRHGLGFSVGLAGLVRLSLMRP